MNTRSLLILACISLGLVVYLGLFGLNDPGSKEANVLNKQIFTFIGNDVDRLELASADIDILLIRGPDNQWVIEKPVQYPANNEQIQRILSELESEQRVATLNVNQFKQFDEPLKQLGLVEARIEVRIRNAEHVYRLAIGNETARPGHFYAQVQSGAESELIVIGAEIESLLSSDIDNWRTKRIFNFNTTAVTALSLNSAGADVELLKQSGDWIISRPFSSHAESMSVNSFLAGMLAARVHSFASSSDSSLAEFGLSAPQVLLEITSGELSDTLSIGKQVSDQENLYYAQVSSKNAVMLITGEFVSQVKALLTRVREKRLITLPLGEISSIQLKGVLADYKVLKEGEQWNFVSDHQQADLGVVNQFYTTLSSAAGVEFFEKSDQNRKAYNLSSPEWRLMIGSNASKSDSFDMIDSPTVYTQVIAISNERNGYRYVDSDYADFLIKVPSEQLPEFSNSRVNWLDRRLSLPETDSWRSISWEVAGVNLVIERENNNSWPDAWNERAIDLDFLKQQMDLLSALPIAARVTLNEDDLRDTDQELVMVIKADTDKIYRLQFGVPINQQVTMALNGESEGYLISEEDYQQLVIFPFDRSVDPSP